jgi:hypothetical protein
VLLGFVADFPHITQIDRIPRLSLVNLISSILLIIVIVLVFLILTLQPLIPTRQGFPHAKLPPIQPNSAILPLPVHRRSIIIELALADLFFGLVLFRLTRKLGDIQMRVELGIAENTHGLPLTFEVAYGTDEAFVEFGETFSFGGVGVDGGVEEGGGELGLEKDFVRGARFVGTGGAEFGIVP